MAQKKYIYFLTIRSLEKNHPIQSIQKNIRLLDLYFSIFARLLVKDINFFENQIWLVFLANEFAKKISIWRARWILPVRSLENIYFSLSANQRKTANLFFYQIARKNIKFFANEFAEKKKEVFTQIDRNYFLCQSEVSKKKIFLGNQIAQKNAVFLPIR